MRHSGASRVMEEDGGYTKRSMKRLLRTGAGTASRVRSVDDHDEHYARLTDLLDRVHPLGKRRALLQRLLEEAVEQDRSATMTAFRGRAEAAALAEHAAALNGLAIGTRQAPFASMFCTDDDGLPHGVARETVSATVPRLLVVDEDQGTLAIHDNGYEDELILSSSGVCVEFELTPTMLTHMYLSHDCDWYSSTGCYEFNEGGEDNSTKNQFMSHGWFVGDLYMYSAAVPEGPGVSNP